MSDPKDPAGDDHDLTLLMDPTVDSSEDSPYVGLRESLASGEVLGREYMIAQKHDSPHITIELPHWVVAYHYHDLLMDALRRAYVMDPEVDRHQLVLETIEEAETKGVGVPYLLEHLEEMDWQTVLMTLSELGQEGTIYEANPGEWRLAGWPEDDG